MFASGARRAVLIREPNPDQQFVIRVKDPATGELQNQTLNVEDIIQLIIEAITAGKLEVH